MRSFHFSVIKLVFLRNLVLIMQIYSIRRIVAQARLAFDHFNAEYTTINSEEWTDYLTFTVEPRDIKKGTFEFCQIAYVQIHTI